MIEFLYGEREALMGKAEHFKNNVRKYLESLGFAQTTDSMTEGTFEDMVFYNSTIAPGKKFVIEAKAENVTLKSKKLAKELVKYFRLWERDRPEDRFIFWLFMQGVKRPSKWKSMFYINDIDFISDWCKWYNNKCLKKDEIKLTESDISKIAVFFTDAKVTVANAIMLELAVLDKRKTSISHIERYGKKLLQLIEKRERPISKISKLIMNILPITLPHVYYVCKSTAKTKQEIYDYYENTNIPPFLFHPIKKEIATFSPLNEDNPLIKFCNNAIKIKDTKELQINNPTLASQLVHIHLRRIIWNKGIYQDGRARIFYYPMLDITQNERKEKNYTGYEILVVKKYSHQKDTYYATKGDINFFQHKAFELRTPTYWKESFIEIVPRRYYTLNGVDPTEGEIRARIDAGFRNPAWNRSINRLRAIRFWKYRLFDSDKWVINPEPWFKMFEFGDLCTESVKWSPEVVGRDQTRLWDFLKGA